MTAGAPSITFAIPFYSGLAYLPRAIESVRAQEGAAWRAFVCDNASPEPGARALVQSFGDPRLTYVRNDANLGMAGNFNRCLDLADTELVTLLHADDELGPRYAATLADAAARYPDAAAFFCRADIIDAGGREVFSLPDRVKDLIHPSPRRETVLRGEPGVRALLKGNFIMAPTLCFRKRVLGARRFPAGYKFVLDLELTMGLLLDGLALVGLPGRCYRYRRHDDNATTALTRTQERFREESAWFDRMQAVARERGWDRCAQLASDKRILKLNLAFHALARAARLHLGDARRDLGLLREL